MKIGVFSDIHGNIDAFEEAHRELKTEGCDMHLFLGDICGYYYHQNDVINLMRQMPSLVALKGNHDMMFLRGLGEAEMMAYYIQQIGRSYDLLKENITRENLDYLKNLRESYISDKNDFAAFHGSPWNPYHEYIYPDSPADNFSRLPYPLVFMGHTHHPMDRMANGIRLINPGSVGQPRNGGPSTYGVFDMKTGVFELREISYSTRRLIGEIRKIEVENEYLVTVLERGAG